MQQLENYIIKRLGDKGYMQEINYYCFIGHFNT